VANITTDFNVVASFTSYNLEITKGDVGAIGRTPTNTTSCASKPRERVSPSWSWLSGLVGSEVRELASARSIYNFDFGLAPYVSYATFFNPQVGTNFFSQPFKPSPRPDTTRVSSGVSLIWSW
jgi:hypothetical protein